NALSLEAHILLPAHNGDRNTILSKWGAEATEQSYRLAVGDDACLEFTTMVDVPDYETDDHGVTRVVGHTPTVFSVCSADPVADGAAHHVVGTYESLTEEHEGINRAWARLRVYVDGVEAGSYDTPKYERVGAVGMHT